MNRPIAKKSPTLVTLVLGGGVDRELQETRPTFGSLVMLIDCDTHMCKQLTWEARMVLLPYICISKIIM
jgi:hypothetical protein